MRVFLYGLAYIMARACALIAFGTTWALIGILMRILLVLVWPLPRYEFCILGAIATIAGYINTACVAWMMLASFTEDTLEKQFESEQNSES